MPSEFPNRRIGDRQPVPRFLNAVLEIPGATVRPRRYPLIDISLYDLCFEIPSDDAAQVVRGESFTGVAVRAGRFVIHCNVTVTRTWRRSAAATHCGARLYPVSDSDQNELIGFVAALESAAKGKPGR